MDHDEECRAMSSALGEEANKKIYALLCVDPTKEGTTSLVRNEEEWQASWELEVD